MSHPRRGPVSSKLAPFGTTIFAEMTKLAQEHQAINLSQGFPDFEGPPEIREAAKAALDAGHNQYARSQGVLPLVEAIAAHREHFYGMTLDPLAEITVTCGATEGIASSLIGLLDPGDEVILFEPYYDSYPACVAMAGAVPRYCTLRFPDFSLDLDALAACFNAKTRVLVLNSPHNPTGKVFSRDELEAIAELCIAHDVVVLADEVYEHLVFDGRAHIPMATLDGMRERTLTLSSAGKTFSFTGWKVGWAMAPAPLLAAVQSAHQFVTFAVSTPLQHAVARALRLCIETDFLADFVAAYTERRDFLVESLRRAGFEVTPPAGTYFVLADFSRLFDGVDVDVAKRLIETAKVATIPPSVFFARDKSAGERLLRFAFCKRMSTLEAAAERLARISG